MGQTKYDRPKYEWGRYLHNYPRQAAREEAIRDSLESCLERDSDQYAFLPEEGAWCSCFWLYSQDEHNHDCEGYFRRKFHC